MTAIEAHAVAATVEARISELLAQRQRDRLWRADWTPARHRREDELRALVRLVRCGRRLARRAVERADPVTSAKAYAELGYHGAQAAYR